MGRGTVLLPLVSDEGEIYYWYLEDVLYVPGTEYNMLSVSSLCERGYCVEKGGEKVEVFALFRKGQCCVKTVVDSKCVAHAVQSQPRSNGAAGLYWLNVVDGSWIRARGKGELGTAEALVVDRESGAYDSPMLLSSVARCLWVLGLSAGGTCMG